MKLISKPKIIFPLIFLSLLLLPFALVRAQTTAASATKPCFTPASGIDFGPAFNAAAETCDPALLANYIVAINIFFFRLAIVLAVLMITLGGFQWLMAIGNASKISNAKDTIQEAVIGLVLALTAYLLFAQIDRSFVELQSLEIGKPQIADSCEQWVSEVSCNNISLTKSACQWNCVSGSVRDKTCSNNSSLKCISSSDCPTLKTCSNDSSRTCNSNSDCQSGATCVSKPGSCTAASCCVKGSSHPCTSLSLQQCPTKPGCFVNQVFGQKSCIPDTSFRLKCGVNDAEYRSVSAKGQEGSLVCCYAATTNEYKYFLTPYGTQSSCRNACGPNWSELQGQIPYPDPCFTALYF